MALQQRAKAQGYSTEEHPSHGSYAPNDGEQQNGKAQEVREVSRITAAHDALRSPIERSAHSGQTGRQRKDHQLGPVDPDPGGEARSRAGVDGQEPPAEGRSSYREDTQAEHGEQYREQYEVTPVAGHGDAGDVGTRDIQGVALPEERDVAEEDLVHAVGKGQGGQG